MITMRSSMKTIAFTALFATGYSLFSPAFVRGEPVNWVRMAPAVVTAAAGAARVAPGGIRICTSAPDDEQVSMTQIQYHRGVAALSGELSSGEKTFTIVSEEDLRELATAAYLDIDGCVTVSLDPIADRQNEYFDSELAFSPRVVSSLLELDMDMALLLEGSSELSRGLSDVVTPPAEARRLLQTNADYQKLARRLVSPPQNWHFTTFFVNPFEAKRPDIEVDVDPTPIFETPDERRVRLEGDLKSVATLPYQPLIERFEKNPEDFGNAVGKLSAGLRYARALGILTACKRNTASCAPQLEAFVLPSARAKDRPLDIASLRAMLPRLVRAGVQMSHLHVVWGEYRATLDPLKLDRDERIAVFIDEAIGHYGSSLRTVKGADSSVMSAERVLALVDGLDPKGSEYEGWVHLGKFIAGVWADRSLADLLGGLETAHAIAERTMDPVLEYQVLKSAEALLPVLESNLYVSELRGARLDLTPVSFDPSRKLSRGALLTPRSYLSHLRRSFDPTLRAHLAAELSRFEKDVAALSEVPMNELRLPVLLKLLGDIDRIHLDNERARLGTQVSRMMARVDLLIGAAAVNEGDVQAARDRLRMIISRSEVEDTRSDSDTDTVDDIKIQATVLESWIDEHS
jgi:hypothetical protein